MPEKLASYILVWNKYLPAIRILIKKSALGEQVIGFNRTDFDKISGTKKSADKFTINFINNQPDSFLFNGKDLIQSFISVLQTDETIRELFSKSNYSFVFTNKYQLQIKNNGLIEQTTQTSVEEAL